jgi:hypothetical protein
VTVYYVTTSEGAARIDSTGFSDAAGYYDPATDRTGVWVADSPVPASQIDAPVVYAIDAPPAAISSYAWARKDSTHVQWFLPASLLNTVPRRRVDG